MELGRLITQLVAWIYSLFILSVSAKRNYAVYCGACIGLVEEMDWGMASSDTTQKLQIGSYRIDSEGNQALNEIPLKYSELNVIELLERACGEVGRYAESRKEDSDKVNFIRTYSRDGRSVSHRHLQISRDTQSLLKFACDTVLEEHEEEIIDMYKRQEQDLHTKLCVDLAGMCTTENITDYVRANEGMVEEAIQEEEDRKVEEARVQAEEEANALNTEQSADDNNEKQDQNLGKEENKSDDEERSSEGNVVEEEESADEESESDNEEGKDEL